MATEIVFVAVSRSVTSSDLKPSLQAFKPPPAGFHEARWGTVINFNDQRLIVGFFTWDTVEDHLKFANSPRFSAVESSVKHLSASWPPVIHHVYFKQGLPFKLFRSRSSVIELITLKRQGTAPWDALLDPLKSFSNAASQQGLDTSFYGTMHEDHKSLIILFGWDSLEV
ncbi:hypothetical protein Clacol_005061 [Clathrus columnatus]|uniref:Monooxygenase n=1 Tax=Clathrus columnatus TaxID=1419009 RepID=A0AAV5ABH8_9AGAM|nr:hypothetical protein Clacol_005061 [Clathrus columnatus]